jgi:protein SCO1/2
LPSAKVISTATAALGFHYVYDPAIDQFAHPAIVYVIGPDGALRSTLSPFALGTTDLRQALAKPAAAPGLFERVRLLCYAYDPATGIYSLRIVALLKIGCIMTVLLIMGAMLFLLYRGRRTA